MFLRHIARFALEIFERTKVLSLFVCFFCQLFNVNFKFRLSCGDETTRVCVCHPPKRTQPHISEAQSPQKHEHAEIYACLEWEA